MFKGAAAKVFQHTRLPFYLILRNCEINNLAGLSILAATYCSGEEFLNKPGRMNELASKRDNGCC